VNRLAIVVPTLRSHTSPVPVRSHIPKLNLGSVLHGPPIHSAVHLATMAVEVVGPVVLGVVVLAALVAARSLRRPFRL